jgi:predicted nucleotidyltransferase
MKFFEGKRQSLEQLCSENKVRSLFAFGSVVRDELTTDSDIDLLVDIESTDPFEYTDNYFKLLEQLELLQEEKDALQHKLEASERERELLLLLLQGR